MSGPAIPPHVHCPSCGISMAPGLDCASCRPISAPGVLAAPAATAVGPAPVRGPAVPRSSGAPPTATVPRPVPSPGAPRPAVRRRAFRPADLWRRYLPPVRLVWLSLLVLIGYGGGFVSPGRILPILAVLMAGVATDLGFQRVRFPKLRLPDAALATSMFLVLIAWPSTISFAMTSVTAAAVGIRHIVRSGGHPWWNPAAAGLAVGVVVFGLPTSWHIGVDLPESLLIVALGALLIAKAPRTWRLPMAFFAAYVPAVIALSALSGGAHLGRTLVTIGPLSAQPLFFGLFMVSEPRTAPSSPRAMPVFAIAVALAAAGLPILFNRLPTLASLGILAPFLALFVGNGLTLVLPAARGHQAAPAAPSGRGVTRPPAARPMGPIRPAGVSGRSSPAALRGPGPSTEH